MENNYIPKKDYSKVLNTLIDGCSIKDFMAIIALSIALIICIIGYINVQTAGKFFVIIALIIAICFVSFPNNEK